MNLNKCTQLNLNCIFCSLHVIIQTLKVMLYVLWFTLPNITKKTNNVDLPKTTQEFKDSTARIPGQAERIRGHL